MPVPAGAFRVSVGIRAGRDDLLDRGEACRHEEVAVCEGKVERRVGRTGTGPLQGHCAHGPEVEDPPALGPVWRIGTEGTRQPLGGAVERRCRLLRLSAPAPRRGSTATPTSSTKTKPQVAGPIWIAARVSFSPNGPALVATASAGFG
jgi:hypothetical protein